MRNQVIILGSGTSTGIPMPGCICQKCTSKDTRDQRFRSSILIKSYNTQTRCTDNILIDTTTDLRQQLLNNKINDVNFVMITHEHADHIQGIDDLRPFSYHSGRKTIPIFTDNPTREKLAERFPYIFQTDKIFSKDRPITGGGIPLLSLHSINISNSFEEIHDQQIFGKSFSFFRMPHGYTSSLGFYHNGLAYLTDCCGLSKNVTSFLRNIKINLLIIDCLQEKKHETHLSRSEAFSLIEQIAPQKCGLIHMNHNFSHSELLSHGKQSNKFTFPLYDNQVLYF